MTKNRMSSGDEYVAFLKREPAEFARLHRELLVGVTRFFRNKAAFTELDRLVISSLLGEDGTTEQALRFWVVGCSTGEEVYSLAMLAQEKIEARRHRPALKIFAPDIQPEALKIARSGVYSFSVSEAIPEFRLSRFFELHGGGFKAKPAIRGPIIFSTHSILSDIPFSRIDLVSFRNLLIYLQPDAQRKALTRIHHALKPNGFLFLGQSETVDAHEDLFRRVSGRGNIYQPVGKSHHTEAPRRFAPLSPGQLTFEPAGRPARLDSAMSEACEEASSRSEELQSLNEELQSANEELQSTNEELETLRDELHTSNERLWSRCRVLEAGLKEATLANDELENAFRSFEIATVILDLDMRIVRHTWAVTSVVQVIPEDAGRPLTDLRLRLRMEMSELSELIKTVLRDFVPHRRHVQHEEGHWYAMKIHLFRRSNNSVGGVSLTFLTLPTSLPDGLGINGRVDD